MQAFKKISFLLTRYTTKSPISNYRGDTWKGRDEASEKVYMAEMESKNFIT